MSQVFTKFEQKKYDRLAKMVKDTPHVLIIRDKYSTQYLVAGNMRELEASTLSVLKARFEAGYYGDSEGPGKPEMTKEQVDALPEGEVKNFALKQLCNYNNRLAEYEEGKAFVQEAGQVIEDRSGYRAYLLLFQRNYFEYEGISLEPLSTEYGM